MAASSQPSRALAVAALAAAGRMLVNDAAKTTDRPVLKQRSGSWRAKAPSHGLLWDADLFIDTPSSLMRMAINSVCAQRGIAQLPNARFCKKPSSNYRRCGLRRLRGTGTSEGSQAKQVAAACQGRGLERCHGHVGRKWSSKWSRWQEMALHKK